MRARFKKEKLRKIIIFVGHKWLHGVVFMQFVILVTIANFMKLHKRTWNQLIKKLTSHISHLIFHVGT